MKNVADILLIIIKNNKISHRNITRLKRAAIGASKYIAKKKSKSLDDIIWWCTVRIINDGVELKKFLLNQSHSKRKEDAIKLIDELGIDL